MPERLETEKKDKPDKTEHPFIQSESIWFSCDELERGMISFAFNLNFKNVSLVTSFDINNYFFWLESFVDFRVLFTSLNFFFDLVEWKWIKGKKGWSKMKTYLVGMKSWTMSKATELEKPVQ